MQLSRLVNVSRRVAGTRSRREESGLLSECLGEAARDEVELAASYLNGTLPQGRIGLGSALLRELAGGEATSEATLTLGEIDDAARE
jgi:DNA ligase-1